MTEKNVLALIPARGGSKRLKNKNVLDLAGKPLIQWTIEAAQKSKYVDDIIVTTDSHVVRAISEKCGVKFPFMRPEKLSGNSSTTLDAINHALSELRKIGNNYTHIVLLQPTSPLRVAADIDSAFELFIEKSATSVVSVTKCEHSPLWANTLPVDRSLDGFIREEVENKRSQDLEQFYRLNGAIYILALEGDEEVKSFYPKSNKYAYEMPNDRSIDIDEELDFQIANLIMKQRI